MEALILAGGFGTRIRPLTYSRPKPLLPIANRTMIERVLDCMPKAVDTVLLPTNYLGEAVRAHFEEHPDPRLVFVDEPEPLGTGGAIKNCEDRLTGPFIVFNADIVSSIRLEDLVAFHRKHRATATISLFPVDEPWHYGVVRLGAQGRILEFVEKPPKGAEPSRLINSGHYFLDPSLLDRMPKGKFVSLEREVFTPLAAEGGAIFGFPFEGYWIDAGRPETYLEAHRLVLEVEGKARVVGDEVEGLRTSTFESYALGDRVHLHKGARIERSVLFADVEIGPKAVVQDSILGQGVEVEAGVHLEKCVVGDFAVIEADAHAIGKRIGMRPGDE